jgi:hypothetical protein
MDRSSAGVTVTVVVPPVDPMLAVTMLVPGATVVPTPPAVSMSVPVSLDVQVAVLVTSPMEASEYVAVARNAIVTPTPTTGDVGVTAMETSVAVVMVRLAVPETESSVAWTVVDPAVSPRAWPDAETDATAPLPDAQVADVVTSWWVPLLSVATAVNATAAPIAVVAVVGVTAIDTMVAGVTVMAVALEKPPTLAVIVAAPGATAVTTLPATVAVAELFDVKAAIAVTSERVASE